MTSIKLWCGRGQPRNKLAPRALQCGARKLRSCQQIAPQCSCGMGQLLMPALQARRLRVTLLCEMHVTEREETVGGHGQPHVGLTPGDSSSEESASLAVKSVIATVRAAARDILSFKAGRAQRRGRVELGLVETQAQQNITQHCYCTRSWARMGQKRAPCATWTRPSTQHILQEHHPAVRCAWNHEGNPTARHAKRVVFQESDHSRRRCGKRTIHRDDAPS